MTNSPNISGSLKDLKMNFSWVSFITKTCFCVGSNLCMISTGLISFGLSSSVSWSSFLVSLPILNLLYNSKTLVCVLILTIP